ncbi:hypothetical protein MMC13_004391, partial [Lambiella insularis]|nr:hypothetical protein [Lambiella insularis]
LDRVVESSRPWVKSRRGLREVWDKNIWITTIGISSVDPMACLLRNTKLENIMYSVDYPFYSSAHGAEFMEKLRTSGLVDEQQYKKIEYENAQKFLGIRT